MRRRHVWCSSLVGFLCSAFASVDVAEAQDQKVVGSAVAFRQNKEVLILYKAGQADQARQQAEQAGFEVLEDYQPGRFLRCVHRQGVAAVAASVNRLAASAAVQVVEPNYIVSIPRPPVEQGDAAAVARRRAPYGRREGSAQTQGKTPDDPRFSELWGMTNIRAPLAWGTNHDSPVVVAVIDTGVDYTHEDLKANMWQNPGESGGGKENNDRDDDGNGIKDDVFGVKFANGVGSGDPKDDNEHGTHCAGTIGAVGDNGTGVVGVNWKVKIMALKFLDASGSGATNDAIRCIDYAIAQKNKGVNIKVLSNSWGGPGESHALQEAITRAEQAGLLFVAAAGNERQDNDQVPNFPSNYPNPNILAVAAIDLAEQKPDFSNFGATKVDLGAPGVGILSSIPNDRYQKLSGTSMATPHVAGAAALVWGHDDHKTKSAIEVKAVLMDKARRIAALSGKCVSGGTLDIGFLGSAPSPQPGTFPQNVAYTGEMAGVGGTFVLNGSSGEASYCLGGEFFRTQLEGKGAESTPDGFEGWVYREDFPNQPFDFLFTRDTIGGGPFHRVYYRPADDPSTPFAWFLDATRCGTVVSAGAAGAGPCAGPAPGSPDRTAPAVDRRPRPHQNHHRREVDRFQRGRIQPP
jgi:subtilisin family serine protease